MNMTENELLAELIKEQATEIDATCEVCAPMLIEQGITQEQAYRTLKRKEAAGELECRYAIYKGQRVKAYYRKD